MELSKQELLTKFDATDITKFRNLSYQFFDKGTKGLGGFAQIRFEKGETTLVCEATFWGNVPGTLVEEAVTRPKMVEIRAERQWMNDTYKFVSAHIDGERYDVESPAMMELAIAIFNSRLDEVRYYAENKLTQETKQEADNQAVQGVVIADETALYRDTLSTVLNEEKLVRAERIARSMPRIAFGKKIIDFNGLDQALAVGE